MNNLSPDLHDKVIASVIVEVLRSGFKTFKNTKNWFKDKEAEYDFLGIAGRQYAERLNERYNSIRIFGMHAPVPLRGIYTRVNILEKITSTHRATVEEMEIFFDRDLRNFGTKYRTKDAIQVANELNKFIVLGKPGAGKTTLLKYITLLALDGHLKENRLPIFIGLKDWSDSGKTLIDFIVLQFDICGFPDAILFVERILSEGLCLLLMDGLDEVSQNEDEIVKQVREFVDKYSNNHFILSCRIAAYNYCFEKFTDVEIADFDDGQIEAYITNWFGEGTQKEKLCLETLQGNKPIKELATRPLLLTMLCLAFDETMGFPANRAELYKEALDALLKKWDSSRSIKRQDTYQHLSLKRKESLFSRIAADAFEKGQYFLRQRQLEKHIASYIENLPEVKQESLIPDSEAVLKAIEAQHGLFVERAKGIYSFSHLTFQEYFTAKYIVENANNGSIKRLISRHIQDDRWREVFLLAAGMLDDADNFLIAMQRKINDIGRRFLGRFLDDVEHKIINPYTKYPITACKALVMFYTLSLSPNHSGRDLSDALFLVRTIDPALGRLIDSNRAETLDNIFDRDRALDYILHLDAKCINGIGTYLKVNKLIIDCLNAEAYVSNSTRQQLLNRLLIVT